MKKIFVTFLALVMLFSLVSCQRPERYNDDADIDVVIQKGLAALNDGIEYAEVEDEEFYLSDFFTMPEWVDDAEIFTVKTQAAGVGYNINEVGIFEIEGKHTSEMQNKLRSYLSESYETNKDWYDSYMPEETPKLRDAEVKVFGNYVVYAILSKDDRATFFNAVQEELLKK